MPAPLKSKDEVVDLLFAVFRDHGYDGATLAEFSRATGLGKSSLYHYFPGGKDDMATAVLDRAGEWIRGNLVALADSSGPPKERLSRMLRALNGMYAGGENACVIGSLVAGGGRPRFQQRLRHVLLLWIGAMERLAIESGIPARLARSRAQDAVAAIQGAIILSGGLADPTPFRRAIRAVPDALLGLPPAE